MKSNLRVVLVLIMAGVVLVSCEQKDTGLPETKQGIDTSGPPGSGDRNDIELKNKTEKEFTGPPGSGDRNHGERDKGNSSRAEISLPTSND